MHPAFQQTDHRPWPLPQRPWVWRQAWLDLAFIHFEADPDELQRMLPAPLKLETFGGKAWIGIVPFKMAGVTRRGWPAPSLVSDFAEINVRTYVTHENRPGVWFLSLDVMSPLVVWFARSFFHLPYHRANITVSSKDAGFRYTVRHGQREFQAVYSGGAPSPSVVGDFSHWATERYCLYSANSAGQCFRAEVQHVKWPLQAAGLDLQVNRFSPVQLGAQHPQSFFSKRLDVVIWPLERLT